MNEQAYRQLTPNRKRFVDAYIANGGHATDAYITSGYKVTNRDSAASAASRLLTDETVQEAIRERTALSEAERLLLNKQIMDNLISKARGEPQEVMEEDDTFSSTPKDADQLGAIDRLHKYYVLSPIQEVTLKTQLRKQELELKLKELEIEAIKQRYNLDGENEEERLMKEIEKLNKGMEDLGDIDVDELGFTDILNWGEDDE